MVAHDKALVGSSSLGFFRCLGEKREKTKGEREGARMLKRKRDLCCSAYKRNCEEVTSKGLFLREATMIRFRSYNTRFHAQCIASACVFDTHRLSTREPATHCHHQYTLPPKSLNSLSLSLATV